ncbi:winged helix-turn-helix domain-containing protein [Xanthocytophaga flava]|uniref:winged helix-turn-helix domain-containing protein n=1 Tax=Xanthocytophaga flava TaxID=3048013 RepID=UPI0028D56997|nr:LysR family transcriptional regulator [Xanthocytophaga flavus]MDJ1472625.1 LysR family transcriptional regulator [Xanthocytophaga flavus]
MQKFKLNGRIWIEGEERFMGIGRMELLEHIQRTGSISQAAKAMQMSYKRAWELVSSMNTQASKPLVITQTGGEKGGGAIVSEEGEKYLAFYKELHKRFTEFMCIESEHIPF